MKSLLLVVSTLLLTSNLLFAQEQVSIQIPHSDTLQQWMAKAKVPALGIATIENGVLNRVLVQGKLDSVHTAPLDALFDVASLTKSVVTMLTLNLVSQGKWSLDTPLAEYWVDPDVANDERHKLLTTRHVLSHQTGFANWRWMHKSGRLTFDFEPGIQCQYSGEGFEYLRNALERKFGQSIEELTKTYIFEPTSMSNSHYVWSADIAGHPLALGHNGEAKAYPFQPSTQANAADNLLTTVSDFGKLGVHILAKTGIKEAVFEEMVTPQVQVRGDIYFGLGWIVLQDFSTGDYALFNAGSDKGVNAVIVLLPKSKRGLILLTNGDGGRRLVMQLIGHMLDVGQELLGRL